MPKAKNQKLTANSQQPTANIVIPAQAGNQSLLSFALENEYLRDLISGDVVSVSSNDNGNNNVDGWTMISNHRFVIRANRDWLKESVQKLSYDVVCITITPSLAGYHEKVCLTPENNIVGIRRYYSDSMELRPTPDDWPHMIFMRSSALRGLTAEGKLPEDFKEFLAECNSRSLAVTSIAAGGKVLDLDSEEGLLIRVFDKLPNSNSLKTHSPKIGEGAKVLGNVIFGDNVSVGANAVITGPAVIGDNVRIRDRAVIGSSIIGADLTIPKKTIVQNRVIQTQRSLERGDLRGRPLPLSAWHDDPFAVSYFRTWPKWSYPRYIKRLFDIVASSLILLLFLPFFPIVVLAIKLSSPGPILYRARRQGLGGKDFDCLKFRSMIAAAEDMQEKLRIVNQVDGPQFKMENDPRINAVGKFLRDTNIDEIPQFINVLRGEMSMIGPRPSPEHENTGCPQWRYARLSVRPGITGLWQICRTRQVGKDFQEWVHYDTEYVKKLSFKLDLWIFFKTARHLINNFVDQF